MKYILTASLLVAPLITGCEFNTVPPAHKGKILSPAGYSPEVLNPGKYTLWGWRKDLVLLETGTVTRKEDVTVVMSDKLTLSADVRFRGRIAGSEKIINMMFNDIKIGKDKKVSFDMVYNTYGQMAVRNKAREVLSQYNVHDVHKNYVRVSHEVAAALREELKGTPLELSDIALGNIKYPDVVTKAVEAAAERDMAIAKEEAQAKIDQVRKKNERLLAEADYQVEITKAKAIRDKNKIIGEGVTPELLQLRALEVQESMAKNGSAVFMPYEAMGNTGAQVRMFNQ